MTKRSIYINLLPIPVWLGLFILSFILKDFEIAAYIGLVNIFLLFIFPLFYGIYNFCAADGVKTMLALHAISLLTQTVGLLLNFGLYYLLISSDSESVPVMQIYMAINVVCAVVLGILGIAIKAIVNRGQKSDFVV